MSDISVDSFLEHYGVKGMKWGVRRSRKQLARENGSDSAPKKGLSPKAKAVRNAAVAVAGAAVVGHLIGKHSGTKVRGIGRYPSEQGNWMVDHLLSNMETMNSRMSDFPKARVPKPIPMGPIGSTGGKKSSTSAVSDTAKFIRDITAKHNETIRKANADLKAGYDRAQTPFPLREFIDEWK